MIGVLSPGSIRSTPVTPSGNNGRSDLIQVVALVIAAQVSAALVLTGICPFVLNVAAGLFLLIVLPVMLVHAKINWPDSIKPYEALVYSLAMVILGIMVVGLLINQVLPLVGVARPLDRVPVTATLLIALTALAGWRIKRWRLYDGHCVAKRAAYACPVIGGRDQALLVAGAIMVLASVAGALRLNNGAGGSVTVAMLILAGVIIVAVFSWRRRLNDSTIMVTIYLLSVSLLLMTSLRGWYVTGHDIQREFRVFDYASITGVWSMAWFRDAYNACVSLTILPTIIERTTGIPEAYIYKAAYQFLYALCPVLIYMIARRFASKPVSILGAVYLVAFPTFFNDMPFLIRQEVAFFFLGTALLLVTDRDLPVRTRQIAFIIFGIAIILSHYSTTYVLLFVLVLGWIATNGHAFSRKLREKVPAQYRLRPLSGRLRHRTTEGEVPVILNPTVILTLAVLTFLWVGPLTGTGGVFADTISSTFNSLKGGSDGHRSADASYSIFGGAKPTLEKRVGDYKIDALHQREENHENYYPLSEVQRYPTPPVAAEQLPVTTLGKAVELLGINVSMLNRLLRSGAAVMLQLFAGFGFLMVLAGRARGFLPNYEFIAAAGACMMVVSSHVLLPDVSVDYGILRTFAQGLFWLAPFLAVGSIKPFGWLGQSMSLKIALAAATVFFLSLTGVIPQLLGGYAPQLNLNNAGDYYDNLYFHPQELTAIDWLRNRVAADPATKNARSLQVEVATDKYSLSRLETYSDIRASDDLFPSLIRKDAYVFMGYTAVKKDKVSFVYGGDTLAYSYPFDFLDNNKSVIYSSDGARIYR